nr:putative metallopeptidase [Pseudorhodoferax sp. Leaf265]
MTMKREAAKALPGRPLPPAELFEGEYAAFAPAPEVLEWIQAEVIAEDGRIHNPDHMHLEDCGLQVLWASSGFIKQGRTVIGQAEQVAFRCGAWQKGRQEQQMRAWFGEVPAFLITLDARYCATCTDVEFCALVEHELYHLSHKADPFGAPSFTKEGDPKIEIRGHDVEEFTGVVRRYGVGSPDGNLAQMIRAAQKSPEVAPIRIAQACGTCLLRVA